MTMTVFEMEKLKLEAQRKITQILNDLHEKIGKRKLNVNVATMNIGDMCYPDNERYSVKINIHI